VGQRLNVALVGCGVLGQKRARALGSARLVACADLHQDRAQLVAKSFPSAAVVDWREAVTRGDVDAVVVATTNNALAPVSLAAVRAGKHVLVEKPAAVTVAEIDEMSDAARAAGVVVRVGFNHRYHPAILKARELFDGGALGPMMFVRARYGHGGRLGYEKEWRADPALAGGGELIDQGVHVIDLARWFLGEFTDIDGFVATFYWRMPVDDNAFLLLRTDGGQAAMLHASSTEWKNLFSFEIYGRQAKLHVEGLGGSYGVERLSWYQMKPEMGPPATTIWEYPGPDRSWEVELAAFFDDIRLGRRPSPGLPDARAALQVVESVYSRARREPLQALQGYQRT
jgi:predicted dehydrogenase